LLVTALKYWLTCSDHARYSKVDQTECDLFRECFGLYLWT